MYEFALERGWDHTPTNLEKWFQQYSLGRYGKDNDFIKKAWHMLRVRNIYKEIATENVEISICYSDQFTRLMEQRP